MRHDPLP